MYHEKYPKFNFPDLLKLHEDEQSQEQEQIHDQTDGSSDQDTSTIGGSDDVGGEDVILDQDIGTQISNTEENDRDVVAAQEVLRTTIYQEGYNIGYAEGVESQKTEVARIESNISDIIRNKLGYVVPIDVDMQKNVVNLATSIILSLARKLHLTLQVNFTDVLSVEIFNIISKYYKHGAIIVKIHSKMREVCENYFEKLEGIVRENVVIITDDVLGEGDCHVEWNDTKFEYTPAQIESDVNYILEQFKRVLV